MIGMNPTMTLPLTAASTAGHSRGVIARPEKRQLRETSSDFRCFLGKVVLHQVCAMLETLGILVVVALVFTLFLRPGATVAIVLAVVVVGAAVVVSWNDIEQTRAQRAANAAVQQQNAAVQPNVSVPPPTPAHSGT
jgi:O-antigen ligase